MALMSEWVLISHHVKEMICLWGFDKYVRVSYFCSEENVWGAIPPPPLFLFGTLTLDEKCMWHVCLKTQDIIVLSGKVLKFWQFFSFPLLHKSSFVFRNQN